MVEVTWCERVRLAVLRWENRTGQKPTELYDRVASEFGESRNTIRKFTRDYGEAPKAKKDRARATALLLALGEPLEPYGLSEADLLPSQDASWFTPEMLKHAPQCMFVSAA